MRGLTALESEVLAFCSVPSDEPIGETFFPTVDRLIRRGLLTKSPLSPGRAMFDTNVRGKLALRLASLVRP